MNNVSEYGFWVDELAEAVRDPRRFINKEGVLPLVTSLEELSEWLNDPRQYTSQHRRAWSSVVDDFEHSISSLGNLSGKYTWRRCNNLLLLLRSLNLGNERWMRQPAALTLRKNILTRIKKILGHLKNEKALISAWDDLVTTTRNITSSPDVISTQRDIFIDFAHLHGKDMGSFGIRRKISDLLRSKTEYLQLRNTTSKNNVINEKIEANQAISIDERLLLCKEAVLEIPELHPRIVWVEITRASLHKPEMDCGDIRLFDGKWLMSKKKIDGNHSDLPSEVRKNLKYFGNHLFSGEKHTVLARISLGPGIVSSAYDEALRLLNALLGLGYTKVEDWIIGEGHLVYANDQEALFTGGGGRGIEQMYNNHTDSLSERIEHEELTTTMVDSRKVDEKLPQLMELMKELESSSDKSAEVKLLAATRLLEHITSWCDDTQSWHVFSKEYIKSMWAREKILTDLHVQIYPILFTGIQIKGVEHEELQKVRQKIIHETHRTYYSYHRGREITNLRTLSKINDLYKTSRSFDWLVNAFTDGASLHNALLKNEDQFESEIDRLVRYRNALEHGGPRHELIADNTSMFALKIASLAASVAMDTFLEGGQLRGSFDQKKRVLRRKYSQLAGGGGVVGILGNR